MSVENLNERTHPELYAEARKVLEACDWQSDRDDMNVYSVSEDVVIATMIHFANSRLKKAERERDIYKRALSHISESNFGWDDMPSEPKEAEGKRLWCWYAQLVLQGFDLDAQAAIREAEKV